MGLLELSKSCGVGLAAIPEVVFGFADDKLFRLSRGDEDAFGSHMAAPRRPKAGLSCFVAYMKRSDAERAVKELDGFDWGGCVLRVGWSKMIRPPVRAIYRESFRQQLGMRH